MQSTENKIMGVLSYISILVLIPILIGEKDDFVRRHINQGLVLCVANIVCSQIGWFVGLIPFIGGLLLLLTRLVTLGINMLCIVGIVYALQGKDKKLPIIGEIQWLK